MRVFADTSALFAVVDGEDQRHAEAATRFRAFREHNAQLVTHNYVIVELIALLHRRLGRAAAVQSIDGLLAPMETRWVTPSLHSEAMAAYRAGTEDASLVDQMSFAVMRTEQLTTAFAFDHDFGRAGFQTVP
ncbi:MAG: type II toxin-antitoxin system VapC family toxin [Candidatus Limnocylindria bacterium]